MTAQRSIKPKLLFLALLLLVAQTFAANKATITIEANKPGPQINPAMWGIFFEDINLGADGGLYAEMVKNRSFEFPDPMMGWFVISPSLAKGTTSLEAEGPEHPADKRFLRMRSEGSAPFGVCNTGFRGMGVRAGEAYIFSAQVRAREGSPRLTVEIVGSDGTTLASEKLGGFTDHWNKYSVTLRPSDTDPKARLNVILDNKATVDLDFISLFPEKTWKNRPGGLRADMVQLLADLKPGFLRFPGGCIVEGSDLSKRYQWKNTIGPIEDRVSLINRWNYEFKHRPTPDYFQSFGLGFFEFFQLAEDIGARPLPILNCGMACQFNSGELVPVDKLDPYVQDALDLIEFANGPVTSEWGAKRAAMGHPEPFNMKLLGVGNEQWGPQYIERLAVFTKALKEKHPEVQLVSAAGPAPSDDRFDFLWPRLRELKADIVDEHCYANPIWFFSSANRFDNYDRNGPKVFFGEYAAQSVAIVSTKNRNNLECALSEAAFMTGLERNADVVRMASYAPLFANIDGWQWTPNLIWTDSLRVFGTPNYYVQQLFSLNRGDVVLPVKLEPALAPATSARGGIGLGTFRTAAEFKDIRVTSGGKTLFSSDLASATAAWKPTEGNWSVKDGAYQQPNPRGEAFTFTGDTTWTDYTLTLKARKIAGSEGFLVSVRNEPLNTRVEWNLGGWGNTKHGLQEILGIQPRIVSQTTGSIETGRWYDVKMEIRGPKVDCYLDGKLVHSAEIPIPQTQPLYATAARDNSSGEIILKAVNPRADAIRTKLKLNGVQRVQSSAAITVLAGKHLDDVNSFENPRHIAPVTRQIKGAGREFSMELPPYSLSVLRLKAD